MQTIFNNLNEHFSSLSSHPKYLLKINSILSSLKIKKVIGKGSSSLHEEDLFEEDITLLSGCKFSGSISYSYVNCPASVRDHLNGLGFNNIKTESFKINMDSEDIKIKIKVNSRDKEITVGQYMKNRNILYLNQNIFDYNFENGMGGFEALLDPIVKSIKSLKIKKKNIKKEIERHRLESFAEESKKSIVSLKEATESNVRDISSYSEEIVRKQKQITSNNVQVEALQSLIDNNIKVLTTKIREISELPFVKKIELTKKGIMVDIGTIELNIDKRDVMGRFRIYITPLKLVIYNLDAIKSGESWYDHPHVKNSNPCLNEWQEKVTELLRGLEFKKLTLMAKLYLCKYNSESPHCNIGKWRLIREKMPLNLKGPIPESGKERDLIVIPEGN